MKNIYNKDGFSEWAKHLRPFGKRRFNKKFRAAPEQPEIPRHRSRRSSLRNSKFVIEWRGLGSFLPFDWRKYKAYRTEKAMNRALKALQAQRSFFGKMYDYRIKPTPSALEGNEVPS